MTRTVFILRRVQTPDELAEALAIRREVFVSEQGIPAELDADGRDTTGLHVLIYDGEIAAATGRACLENDEATLARIAVRREYRGHGLGGRVVRELERWAVEEGANRFVLYPHAYLESFYEPRLSENLRGWNSGRTPADRDGKNIRPAKRRSGNYLKRHG